MIGAVLTQNTAWRNVEQALIQLRKADALTMRAIHEASTDELIEHIRPAGTYRIKAKRLKALAACVMEDCGGSLEVLFEGPMNSVRSRLLRIHGIGPETADAITLYAGNRPTFVMDAYARRVLIRHGLASPEDDYDALKTVMESSLERNAQIYNEYHALIVAVGKNHCGRKATCEGCPLTDMPHDPERC